MAYKLYKAVVRKIPNFLTEEAFYQGFNVDLPIDYRYFVPGKTKDRNDFSVAYYGFELRETMEQFINKFHNFIIQDEKGKSYVLLVQRCVYQSLPYDQRRKNLLQNTITETDDYKEYIEKQNQKLLQEQAKLVQVVEEPKKEEVVIVEVVKSEEEMTPESSSETPATEVVEVKPVVEQVLPKPRDRKLKKIAPLVQAMLEKEQNYQENRRQKGERKKQYGGDKDQQSKQQQQQQQPQYRVKQKNEQQFNGQQQQNQQQNKQDKRDDQQKKFNHKGPSSQGSGTYNKFQDDYNKPTNSQFKQQQQQPYEPSALSQQKISNIQEFKPKNKVSGQPSGFQNQIPPQQNQFQQYPSYTGFDQQQQQQQIDYSYQQQYQQCYQGQTYQQFNQFPPNQLQQQQDFNSQSQSFYPKQSQRKVGQQQQTNQQPQFDNYQNYNYQQDGYNNFYGNQYNRQ